MPYKRWALLALLVIAIAAAFAFDVGHYLSFDYLKTQQAALEARRAAAPLMAALLFFVAYLLIAALALPGAAIPTLAAGAIFGVTQGTLLVSFASSLGATLAFLASRYLLHDYVKQRFESRLAWVYDGFSRDGPTYLATLRLLPVVPFAVVNVLMGLTPVRTWTFYWVSQLCMLPATLIYVNAGTALANIESPRDIVSPQLLTALALLAVLPFIARVISARIRQARVYRHWRKPARFDRNLVVIGAGAAGLVTAYIGAAVKASVSLIERHRMGGDCLNTGCVPSKALLHSAREVARQRSGSGPLPAAEFRAIMQRIHGVIERIAPHDSVARYRSLGVDVIEGSARLVSPWEVEITAEDGSRRVLSSKAIVLATGAEPTVPPIHGLDGIDYLTSDSLWSLAELPRRLAVLGGGPIGCELAQAFARLGAELTVLEQAPRILPREDAEVSDLVAAALRDDGVTLLTGHTVKQFSGHGRAGRLTARHADGDIDVDFDAVLVAVGRRPRLTGLGLEDLGIDVAGRLQTNAFLQTRLTNIYAAGDVNARYQFTHVAGHEAWYAAVNALFDPFRKFRADYSVIPWATFTEPEIARVGLSESEAREAGIPFEITRYDFADFDRAIADEAANGFIRILTPPGKDRILGVTIAGPRAADLISEFVLAMRHGLGLRKVLGTIHIYPSYADANKLAAGAWQRAHAPERLLRWVERFHRWRRGGR